MTGEDGGATGIVCRIFSCSKAEVTAVKMLCGLQIIITDMNDEQKAEFCKEALIPEGYPLSLNILKISMRSERHCFQKRCGRFWDKTRKRGKRND